MPTNVNVTNLKINKLTEAQYDAAVQSSVIGENELSVITDMVDKAVQVSALPTASATELGNIYQFTGTTDANYTNGYFYKCVSDGQTPATYSWAQTDVQPQAGGLPSQTGNAGKFLTTDGTDASWSDKPLVNNSNTNTVLDVKPSGGTANSIVATAGNINIGSQNQVVSNSNGAIVTIGNKINTGASTYTDGIVIAPNGVNYIGGGLILTSRALGTYGNNSRRVGGILINAGNGDAQIGDSAGACSTLVTSTLNGRVILNANYTLVINNGYDTNITISEANTFWWGNSNGMYKLINSDGTIPAARHATLPSADGTYVLKLVIADGTPTLSWVAE